MGTLSGEEIRRRLTTPGLEERLVITPLLEPKDQLRSDQASIDVRLGFEFALISPSSYASIDEFERSKLFAGPDAFGELYKRHYVPFGRCIVIHPHQFILASTLEYFRLPKDLNAYVIGRSTWGRLGLIVATAVGVQPGFAGALTLELRNLGETPINLYPGEVVAQLFLHNVERGQIGETAEPLSQYAGAVDLLPRQLSSDATRVKLLKLKERADKLD